LYKKILHGVAKRGERNPPGDDNIAALGLGCLVFDATWGLRPWLLTVAPLGLALIAIYVLNSIAEVPRQGESRGATISR